MMQQRSDFKLQNTASTTPLQSSPALVKRIKLRYQLYPKFSLHYLYGRILLLHGLVGHLMSVWRTARYLTHKVTTATIGFNFPKASTWADHSGRQNFPTDFPSQTRQRMEMPVVPRMRPTLDAILQKMTKVIEIHLWDHRFELVPLKPVDPVGGFLVDCNMTVASMAKSSCVLWTIGVWWVLENYQQATIYGEVALLEAIDFQ
jgi:hypothetical protein